MIKTKKLIIFGDSAFAEIAYEYFQYDSDYEVCGFTISKEFITKEYLFNLPVVPFENVTDIFPSCEYEMHIALVYNSLNRVREKFYKQSKSKGYNLANYISSKSFIWKNVILGDNVFIFEDNTIQPFVKIMNNNVFWSGNHIGHHSEIGSNNFFSSHVVMSGFCEVGNNNFFGVNSTISNNIKIGDDCVLGSFTHIVKSIQSGTLLRGSLSVPEEYTTWSKFNMKND